MSVETDEGDSTASDVPAPDGWHWGLGTRSTDYYDYWLYSDKVVYDDGEFGWEGHLYHDNGGKHHVEFIQYTRLKPDGDTEYSHPKHQRSFDTEREAVVYLIDTASDLR